ncbi:MAG: homoserine dehydrogenase [Kiritimatiellia bacterium]|jgi:homoserine dehydrogenase
MKEIGIGVLGFGTVGAGVVQALIQNADLLADRSGVRLVLRKVVDRDITTDRGVALQPGILSTNVSDVLDAADIDIVVELIGGTTIAKEFMIKALSNGKSVVTANKALLAECGEEVFKAAEEHHTDLFYEASVGGGIPVIKALREGLVANHIDSIYGILNGTCNYILTRMERDGDAFDDVLKDAQALGFAEAEPGLDIDGVDTAHKAVLLASIAFGRTVTMDEVYTEGIRGLSTIDIRYALELGYRIKLLGVIRRHNDALDVRVHPTLVPVDHMLAKVDGVYNAVLVNGDIVGQTLYYGRGAGREPTASAVVADIVDIARNIALDAPHRLAPQHAQSNPLRICPVEEIEARYYLRLSLLDRPGTLAAVAKTLGDHGISIASVIQKTATVGDYVPAIILTRSSEVRNVLNAIADLEKMDVVGPEIVRFMVHDLDYA